MKIGIDARLLYYQKAGIGLYTLHLLRALSALKTQDSFAVLTSRKERTKLVVHPNFRQYHLWTPCHHALEQWTLPLELAPLGLDLIHSPDFIPPFRRRCKAVITVHDLAFLRFPDLLTEESARYYGQIRRAVESAEGIIAVSEATRRDMADLLGTPPERVTVIHHGIEERFRPLPEKEVADFCQERRLPESYLLWFSTIEPRKNLDALLRALALLRTRGQEVGPLVIAGARGWLYERSLKLIDELRLGDMVVLYGPAPADDLPFLYNGASLFVFPSLYEGFGFPPLEAMACGTPVISSSAPALREVLGEAALFFEALDIEALAGLIYQVQSDSALRERLGVQGTEQAAKYTWQQAAESTLALYHKVLAQ